MKKMILMLMLFQLTFSLAHAEGIKNPDKPLKGEWNLNPQLVWKLESSTDVVLAKPNIAVSDDGTCYVYDYKTCLNYVFDSRGNFKRSFGKKGEGPGEIKWQLLAYTVNKHYIIADRDRLHYFSPDGTFKKTLPNQTITYFPQFFIDENEFIARTWRDKGEISHVNLKNNQKTKIASFASGDKEITFSNGIGLRIPGLHSEMISGYHRDSKKIYYGMNDSYVITVADPAGDIVNTFSVDRPMKKVSKEAVKKAIKVMHPDIPVNERTADYPTGLTYFNRIQVVDGFVYVFNAALGSYWDSQPIDIFSLEGKYLYRASFTPGEDSKIYFPMLNNILIKKGHLYVVLEEDEGEVVVSKYKITLPKNL